VPPQEELVPTLAPDRRVRRWWLDWSVRAKCLLVVAIPIVTLACVGTAGLALGSIEGEQRRLATADRDLTSTAAQVLQDAVDAETSIRGYGVTGDPLFLNTYTESVARLPADRSAMLDVVATTSFGAEGELVDATVQHVFAQLVEIRTTIESDPSDSDLTRVLNIQKSLMDDLREQVATLVAGPAASLIAERDKILSLQTKVDALNIAGIALSVLAGIGALLLFTYGLSRRITVAAANADRLGAGEPLEPVAPSGDELGQLANSLVRAETLLASRAAELTSARDVALRATDAKNRFLSHTSHELRTPLNSILGFTQILGMSDLSDEDHDSAERILTAGRHLLALINELIDIARIESGDLNLSLEPASVLPLVEEASQLMSPLAAERTIEISFRCENPALAVFVDRQRLSQVLVNLISNAIKYNRHNGSIAITCQAQDPDEVTIDVSDTGPGLLPDELERMFVPFERLGAGNSSVEGTGIGLPLSRALSEAMGGRLSATTVPGEGSTFTITVPRAPDLAPSVPTAPEHPTLRRALEPAGRRITVLYIEDNPANIEVISRYMNLRLDATLTSARTGRRGLHQARTDQPDIILLDLHLPDMHGREVMNELRADPRTAAIPVVVLTADASPDLSRHLRALGALSYLTKPIELSELGELLDSASSAARDLGVPTPTATPTA
jgi:signal transduction histidine kinase/CheY-like chemotaxis protein